MMIAIRDRVRIINGPFAPHEGVVVARPTRLLSEVTVAVRFIRQTVRIVVAPEALELILESPFEPQAFVDAGFASVGNELIRHLAKHPRDLFAVSPRRFEELVAELLRDMGYDVYVTPQTRDGGRDILAVVRLPASETLTIVDCKRYSPDQPIGPDIVQRLMWIADRNDRASTALVATTSRFTSGAQALAREYRWRLGLKDFGAITEWLERYGTWEKRGQSGVWLSAAPSTLA